MEKEIKKPEFCNVFTAMLLRVYAKTKQHTRSQSRQFMYIRVQLQKCCK